MSRSGASLFRMVSGSFLCSVATGSEQVSIFELTGGAMSGFFSGAEILGLRGSNLVSQFMMTSRVIVWEVCGRGLGSDVFREC